MGGLLYHPGGKNASVGNYADSQRLTGTFLPKTCRLEFKSLGFGMQKPGSCATSAMHSIVKIQAF